MSDRLGGLFLICSQSSLFYKKNIQVSHSASKTSRAAFPSKLESRRKGSSTSCHQYFQKLGCLGNYRFPMVFSNVFSKFFFFFFSLSKSPIKITQYNSSSSPKCKRPRLCIFSLESSSTLPLRLLIPDKLMFCVPALSTKSCGSTSTPWAKLPLSAFQNHPYLIALMSRCL